MFETETEAVHKLEGVHGILVPGGFGVARHSWHDRSRAIRPRTPGAVFRHLLWHAHGDHRGGARPRRPARRRLDRIRAVPSPGGRADDRMDARQYRRAAQFDRRSRRHDAARRLSGGAGPGKPGGRDLSAPSGSANAIATVTRSMSATRRRWRPPACGFPACRPTACCRRLSKSRITPGISACNFTRNSNRSPSSRTRCSPPSSAPRSISRGWFEKRAVVARVVPLHPERSRERGNRSLRSCFVGAMGLFRDGDERARRARVQ